MYTILASVKFTSLERQNDAFEVSIRKDFTGVYYLFFDGNSAYSFGRKLTKALSGFHLWEELANNLGYEYFNTVIYKNNCNEDELLEIKSRL